MKRAIDPASQRYRQEFLDRFYKEGVSELLKTVFKSMVEEYEIRDVAHFLITEIHELECIHILGWDKEES